MVEIVDNPEHFYRSIVANTRGLTWVISRDWEQVFYINDDFSGIQKERFMAEGMSVLSSVLSIESLETLLEAFRKAANEGLQTEDLETEHRNALTGETEYFMNTVSPIFDRRQSVSHIQVSSYNSTALVRARKTMEMLNAMCDYMQKYMARDDILERVGRRLRKKGITIFVSVLEDEKISRLIYANLLKRQLKKIFKLLEVDPIGTGFHLDDWPQLGRALKLKKAQYYHNSYMYLRTRLANERFRMIGDLIPDIFARQKIIVVPLIADRKPIGSIFMASEKFTELDVGAVTSFSGHVTSAVIRGRLRDSREKYTGFLNVLLENVSEGILKVDEDARILSCSRSMEILFPPGGEGGKGCILQDLGLEDELLKQIMIDLREARKAKYEGILMGSAGGRRRRFSITALPDEENGSPAFTLILTPGGPSSRRKNYSQPASRRNR